MRISRRIIQAALSAWITIGALASPTSSPATRPSTRAAPRATDRIVIIVDMGGQMLPITDRLRARVSNLVAALDEGQPFNVLAMTERRDGAVAFRDKPVPMNEDTLRRVDAFLENISPRGSPDVQMALKASLRMRPDAIYLLVAADRGAGEKNTVKIPPKVPVHVVVFFAHDGAAALQISVAKTTGGSCVDEHGKKVLKILKGADDDEHDVILREEKGKIIPP